MHSAERPLSLAEERLRRAYESGRSAHPSVALPFETFARYARRAVPRVENGDYYLAVACDVGAIGAWERLQERFGRPLRAMMRRRGAGRRDVDDLLEDVWGRLAGPSPRSGIRTRMGSYDGQGPLLAWLATVGWRRLMDAWRAGSAATPLPGQSDEALWESSDPARCVEESETEQLVGTVLEEAWAALTLRELEVVVLKYRHHLPQREIAKRLRISPARVTRLLQSAARRLRKAVQRRFELRAYSLHADSNQAALLEILRRMLSRSDVELPDRDANGRGAG